MNFSVTTTKREYSDQRKEIHEEITMGRLFSITDITHSPHATKTFVDILAVYSRASGTITIPLQYLVAKRTFENVTIHRKLW
jgi:hypothetical protein